jgi:hypothetical protein
MPHEDDRDVRALQCVPDLDPPRPVDLRAGARTYSVLPVDAPELGVCNLYATDASPYRILPAAVLRAHVLDDLYAAVEACRAHRLPITVRGAET